MRGVFIKNILIQISRIILNPGIEVPIPGFNPGGKCTGIPGLQTLNMILSTIYDKYLLLFTTKSKQTSELCQKRGFNGSTGVIGYADSEYDIVNNMISICCCLRLKSILTRFT